MWPRTGHALIEVAELVASSGDGVDNDQGALASLESVDGVHQAFTVLAEAVLQACLQRVDLVPERGDHRHPIRWPFPFGEVRPFACWKDGVVLKTTDELVNDGFVHSVGPVGIAPALVGDPTRRTVDQDERAVGSSAPLSMLAPAASQSVCF
jgi:hypothetical protein